MAILCIWMANLCCAISFKEIQLSCVDFGLLTFKQNEFFEEV